MDPLIGSSLVTAGGSMLGSLLGIGNQKATIKAQQKMQREAMQWQTAERVATQNYNTDMWNKQNEYNAASAQRQRLEEAGLNPYLMMNGGDAGSASSVTGSYSGAPSSPNYQAYDIGGNVQQAFSQVGQQLYNSQLQKSQIEKNYSDVAKSKADALLAAAQTKDSDAFRQQKLSNLEWQGKQMESAIHVNEEEKNLKHAQYIYQNMDNDAKAILNKYLEPQQQAQLFGLITSINEAYTRMDLNRAKAKEALAGALDMYMGARLKKGEAEILERTMESSIDKMNVNNLLESQLMLGEFEAGSTIGWHNIAKEKYGKEYEQNRLERKYNKTLNNLTFDKKDYNKVDEFLGIDDVKLLRYGIGRQLGQGKFPYFPF